MSTIEIIASVACIIKGDTPSADMLPIRRISGFILHILMRRLVFGEKRNRITHAADRNWDIIVATAAPLTPMLSPNIRTGSSAILTTAPMRTEIIATEDLPCAVMNILSPTAICTKIVPIRYIEI